MVKICSNCGNKLLEAAKKCTHCGIKDENFPIFEKSNISAIKKFIENVPYPKSGKGKGVLNVEMKQQIWNSSKIKKEEQQKDLSVQEQLLETQRDLLEIEIKRDKNTAKCPKCGSISLSGNKKGFGIGKAIIGTVLLNNPIGAIAGNINAKKVWVTCLKCGKKFKS